MAVTTKVPLGESTLVRKWYLDVNTGTYASPVWTGVFGISSFTPGKAPTKQDGSDFDGGGWKSESVTALAWSLSLTLQRKVQESDATVYDTGQEALRSASDEIGIDNRVDVRWYEYKGEAGGPEVEAYRGYASVDWNPPGGAMDALDTVAVVLTGVGARTAITHPATAAAPTIYAVSPASGVAGDLVKITGIGFIGATDVDFDAIECTDYVIHDNHTIYAVAPAGGSGAEAVEVTNATGQSSDGVTFTYTA